MGAVRRARLHERLEQGAQGPVTLVSGPAGSGKTLLVASWLRETRPERGSVAWVSVERDEWEASSFWAAVVSALRASGVAARAKALRTLTPAPHGPDQELVRRLLDGLRTLRAPVVLVLDDLHQLKAPEALDGLGAFLADAPTALRTILITRGAPDLGLHRLRLIGGLTEIRTTELAFTLPETRELLRAAGIVVSDDAAERLRARTEGWVAGLRLAALSLAGRGDPDRLVSGFSGNEQAIADYFLAEVLASHRPAVRRLLLRTSVLERVNGPLANLLASTADGERLLRELEAANAFVTSVDAGRAWFRYHPLLADLLRDELRRQGPDEVHALHRTAARWYAAHGYAVEAIRHAQRGQDWEYAGDLLAEHWFTLFLDGEQAAIRGLLSDMPIRLVRSDAELAALVAADRLAAGRLHDADAYVALAERLAGSVRRQHVRRFEVTLAVVMLTRARTRGDFEATVRRAHAILAPADGETWAAVSNDDLRALALMNLGYVEYWALRLEEAERHLGEGLALAREIGRPYIALGCLGPWAHIGNMQTRHEAAEVRSREAIELADRLGWSEDPFAGSAYTALGGGFVSRGRLQEGESWLARAKEVLDGLSDPEASVSLPFGRGAMRMAQGRYEEAIECFREAVAQPPGSVPAPHYLSASAKAWELRARICLGDTTPARVALANVVQAGAARTVDWCNVAASLHIAEELPQAAIDALAPVFDGSAPLLHANFEVEARILEAIARDHLGESSRAEQALERALDRAAPARLLWTFFTQAGVRRLLERHPRHRTAHGPLIDELLGQFARTAAPRRGAIADRHEPLTERELTVLRLLATNLTAAELASELLLSFHTVKSHMRSIYAKLGAHRRGEAVQRGRACGLLGDLDQRPRSHDSCDAAFTP